MYNVLTSYLFPHQSSIRLASLSLIIKYEINGIYAIVMNPKLFNLIKENHKRKDKTNYERLIPERPVVMNNVKKQ